jgi:hypothetical protein
MATTINASSQITSTSQSSTMNMITLVPTDETDEIYLLRLTHAQYQFVKLAVDKYNKSCRNAKEYERKRKEKEGKPVTPYNKVYYQLK